MNIWTKKCSTKWTRESEKRAVCPDGTRKAGFNVHYTAWFNISATVADDGSSPQPSPHGCDRLPPSLSTRYKIIVQAQSLTGQIKVFSSQPLDGSNTHFAQQQRRVTWEERGNLDCCQDGNDDAAAELAKEPALSEGRSPPDLPPGP